MFKRLGWMVLSLAVLAMPTLVDAAGGSGGGGGTTTYEVRVTGYIKSIDLTNGVILVGQSYYGSGAVKVTSSTKISLNNTSCDLTEVQLNDWAEVRYDWYTKVASRVAITR